MQCIIRVESGPESGTKVWLRTGQEIKVGRTELADFVIANDESMSEVHFAVRCDATGCSLIDLDSVLGTFVNDRRVASSILAEGDVIAAGSTRFLVRSVEGATKVAGALPTQPARATAIVSSNERSIADDLSIETHVCPHISLGDVGPNGARYARILRELARPMDDAVVNEECYSMVTRLRSAAAEPIPAWEIVSALSRYSPAYVIIDPRPLGESEAPDISGRTDYLFDWLPEHVVAAASPRVCQLQDPSTAVSVFNHAWGKDALVCCFSRHDCTHFVSQLRAKLLYQFGDQDAAMTTEEEAQGNSAPQSILAYYRPSMLSTFLSSSEASVATKFLEGVDAILVEHTSADEQTKGAWQLFLSSDFSKALQAAVEFEENAK